MNVVGLGFLEGQSARIGGPSFCRGVLLVVVVVVVVVDVEMKTTMMGVMEVMASTIFELS